MNKSSNMKVSKKACVIRIIESFFLKDIAFLSESSETSTSILLFKTIQKRKCGDDQGRNSNQFFDWIIFCQ